MAHKKYDLPIGKFNERTTPFYYYDMQLLADTIAAIKEAMPEDLKLEIIHAIDH